MALQANYRASNGGSLAKDRKYSWLYELEHYRKYHSLFNFIYLGAAIPVCCLGKSIELKAETLGMTIVLLILGGLSITIGQSANGKRKQNLCQKKTQSNLILRYHRLRSHRSFKANKGLQYFLAFIGAGQLQWSIMWWTHHHRTYHQYTDTDRDPYNARRGFFFSHVGWMLGPNQESWGPVNLSELRDDPVVIWQQRYYISLALASGALLPTTIAYFGWNNWKGGLLYGRVPSGGCGPPEHGSSFFVGWDTTILHSHDCAERAITSVLDAR